MAAPLDRLTSALAGRYTILREVGSGGMATVYLAEDVKHHRKVAVKVLRPELAATLGPERFFREIEIAAQLQHPHILPLLDSGEAEGFLYYVMPFVEGESLRERLARHGELPVHEAVRILLEVVDALAHAHKRGVVHRDIKPDNVMLSERHALVTDFGVAKAVSEATGRNQLTTAGVALGTPAYMAPEQAAADPNIDHRADIYAVGALGYELLAGRPPFTGSSSQEILAAHVTMTPEPVSTRRPAVPPALANVIMKCLAKRPADRWQSAEELRTQLEQLSTPTGGSTPTGTAPYAAVGPDPWYGHPIRVAGLFTLASIAVLGAVYFLTIQLGLPDWVQWGAVALLAAGLPIMIVTGLVERRRAFALATGRATQSGASALHGWITWRKAITGGITAFALLGVLTLLYTAMRLLGIGPVGTLVASGKLAARDKVVVADFANRTTDSTLGPSVTEAFRIDLAQSPLISVLSSSAVGEALERMNRDPGDPIDATAAREVTLREGGTAYVVGEISPVGKGLVLSARLLSPADGAELVALRETAENDGAILSAIDRLSRRLRERIGESLRTIRANPPLEKVTTGSLEALRLYTQGARAHDLGEFDRAADLLGQAVAADSSFAMAWRKLAATLGFVGTQSSVVDASTRAFQHRERLPEIERRHTEAFYYWIVAVDLDRAIQIYQSLLDLNPDDNIALNNLSGLLTLRRQFPEAERLAARLAQLHPADNNFVLVDALLRQGKRAEAMAEVDRGAKAVPESPAPMALKGLALASVGQWDSAQRVYSQLLLAHREPLTQWWAAGSKAALARTRGRLDEAERYDRESIALSEQRKVPSAALVAATTEAQTRLLLRGDRDGALRIMEAALQRHPLGSLPAYDRPYTDVAMFYALAGQPAKAKSLLAEYAGAVPEAYRRGNPGRHTAAGYVALAEGRPQDAITEFRATYDESGCSNCALYELGTAYDLAHQPDSALAAYERAATTPGELLRLFQDDQTLARSYKRLGELYEERGNTQKALDDYSQFVKLWQDADPVLQPQVREVKERMAKLAGER